MIEGITFENTPDFEYVYEDVVKLPEFDLYHVGLGIYRFEKPVIYSKSRLNELKKKYDTLEFFYIDQTDDSLKLLFVMSVIYSRVSVSFIDVIIKKYKELFPKGYDSDVDEIINGAWGRHEIRSDSEKRSNEVDRTNMLLGFRWDPKQRYDEYGRKRYIMLDGYVAKWITEGIYAFDGKITGNKYEKDYPCFDVSDNKVRCAVVGTMADTGGSVSIYLGTATRYIAFDDAGISRLKKFYEYTVGYEYKESNIIEKEAETNFNYEQRLQREKERKEAYQIGSQAVELVKGIGYRDITIYCRLLFDTTDIRVRNTAFRYDFTYLEEGILKLVDIYDRDTKVHSIPTGLIAELYVMGEEEICPGIREKILTKVIDNTWFEKNSVGIDQYDQFMDFAKRTRRSW